MEIVRSEDIFTQGAKENIECELGQASLVLGAENRMRLILLVFMPTRRAGFLPFLSP